jgi:integrase
MAKPGRHGDGHNLYLQVRGPLARSWLYRYRDASGMDRTLGLGNWPVVSLDAARAAALDYARLRKEGRDPLAEKRAQEARADALDAATFRQAAAKVIELKRPEWVSSKHAQQWENSLSTYVFPRLGDLDLRLIDTNHVVDVLAPIWTKKIETARRVQNRIAAILAWGISKGLRDGPNPADMERLKDLLASQKKVQQKNVDKAVKHHAALPYREAHGFILELRDRDALAARCLEFCVLTSVRTANAISAKWADIDLQHAVWTIPAADMKAKGKGDHVVPLSKQAVALLNGLRGLDEVYVFPSPTPGKPLSNMAMLRLIDRMGRKGELTTHGFRSTFLDWVREETNHDPDAARLQLAHTIDDKTGAAYRRGNMYRKRALLVQEWADYIDAGPGAAAALVPMHRKGRA